MALAAVAAHKIGGLIPVGAIFEASIRIGDMRRKAPEPVPAENALRILR
jgi:hypothetical protein